MQIFLSFRRFMMDQFVIERRVKVRDVCRIFRCGFKLRKRAFMRKFLARITMCRSLLARHARINVAQIRKLRNVVHRHPIVTISGTPVINALHLTVCNFGVRHSASQAKVIFRRVVHANVARRFNGGTLSSRYVPITAPCLTTRCRQALLRINDRLLRFIVTLLCHDGLFVHLRFPTCGRTSRFCPFDLPRQNRLLVSRVKGR